MSIPRPEKPEVSGEKPYVHRVFDKNRVAQRVDQPDPTAPRCASRVYRKIRDVCFVLSTAHVRSASKRVSIGSRRRCVQSFRVRQLKPSS